MLQKNIIRIIVTRSYRANTQTKWDWYRQQQHNKKTRNQARQCAIRVLPGRSRAKCRKHICVYECVFVCVCFSAALWYDINAHTFKYTKSDLDAELQAVQRFITKFIVERSYFPRLLIREKNIEYNCLIASNRILWHTNLCISTLWICPIQHSSEHSFGCMELNMRHNM